MDFLGHLEGEAIVIPFLDVKIEKKIKIGYLGLRKREIETERIRGESEMVRERERERE